MIQSLLKYQETDAKLRDIEIELSKSEERKKAKNAQKYLEGVDENLNKLELKAGELYLAYENAVKELEKYKKALKKYEEEARELVQLQKDLERRLEDTRQKYSTSLNALNSAKLELKNLIANNESSSDFIKEEIILFR